MDEPWVRYEDDDVIVVSKPPGVNTHRADVNAQEGMHEWVQRRRPGVSLSILHRLDKGTSGLLLFGKTTAANRELGRQFAEREIAKDYLCVVCGSDSGRVPPHLRVDTPIPGRRDGTPGRSAVTDFEFGDAGPVHRLVRARPHTGRTHQIRIHAAGAGMPIVGDTDHGGPAAPRLALHSTRLGFVHPSSAALVTVEDPMPPSFATMLAASHASPEPASSAAVAREARDVLFDRRDTDCHLWIDRHHDGFPDLRVERLGDVALAYRFVDERSGLPAAWVDALMQTGELRALYLQHRPRRGATEPPSLVAGAHPSRFPVREQGRLYQLDLTASATSTGLFLDQRETRRRLASMPLAGKTVLNAFAHTGSLSVAAADGGAETLTLDLSRHYLDWACENLSANGHDPADHDFVYGDALDWMDRFAKKGRTFDVVVVDPPSSSTPRSKSHRGSARWTVDRDLHELVARSASLTAPGGTMFVSTNLRKMRWDRFIDHVDRGLLAADRTGTVETQTVPLDHRIGPGEIPYLKAAWIRLDA